jgi:hypothetical protein
MDLNCPVFRGGSGGLGTVFDFLPGALRFSGVDRLEAFLDDFLL